MLDNGEVTSSFIMKDTIPFQCVKWTMYVKLANKLDPDSSIIGGNWRMLAEKLGYSTQDILVFECQQTTHGRNTIKVLQDYCQKQGSTVNQVLSALEEINRPDALDELKDGLSEIEEEYEKKYKKKHSRDDHKDHAVENDFYCTSCDSMAYQSDSYNYSPAAHHKQLMTSMNKYSMGMGLPSNHPISMATGSKQYQRHKSTDLSGMNGRSRMSGFEHSSPEFKRQRSMPLTDSMIVQGHENHSQYYRDMEPMDQSPSIRDDPVPPALAMMRNMPQFAGHSGLMSTAAHGNRTSDVEMSGIFRHPYPHTRLPLDRPGGLKLDITSANDPYIRQHNVDFVSPSPTPTSPGTPLVHLEKLANERKFLPNEEYNDLMRLKHQEEFQQQNKGGHIQHSHFDNHIGDKTGHGSHNMHPSHQMRLPCKTEVDCDMRTNRHSDELVTTSSKQKQSEPPNTYPLRLKSNSCSSTSSTMSSVANLQKSVSLPNNMKPAEFRKAFRHIKVFVTYAADDKRHTQRVLNVCKCLERNGFTCCVDIFHRKLQMEDRHNWYQKRFEEADFILVVMSQKYRREVDNCEIDNDADDSNSVDSEDDNDKDDRPHRLHTKHIYRLMYREYVQNGQRCVRFVPLLFQGINSEFIPRWMIHAYNRPLVYEWPREYKDLLWMLTKPENRVPEHIPPPPPPRSLPDSACSHDTSDSSEINVEESE